MEKLEKLEGGLGDEGCIPPIWCSVFGTEFFILVPQVKSAVYQISIQW